MELYNARQWFTERSTIGALSIEGRHECFVLEDVVRDPGVKIDGETAIPAGRYRIVMTPSDRVLRMRAAGTPDAFWSPRKDGALLLLLDVPTYDGIRFHAGNRAAHTRGCPLTGLHRGVDEVTDSRRALVPLMAQVDEALATAQVWITIENVRGGTA